MVASGTATPRGKLSCSGFLDTADDAAEFEDSDFDDGWDAGFDDTDYA